MENIKVLILVLSYSDNGGLYDKFQKTQIETWDSVSINDVKTFYFYGNHSENKIINNRIHLKVNEGLWNCGLKTIESLKIINNYYNYNYLFRTNSSSYIDKRMLLDFLDKKPKEKYYAGHSAFEGKVHYVSGSGIILSKDLVEILINGKINTSLMDDSSIGELMNLNGIYPEQIDRCNGHDNYIFNDLSCNKFLYRLKSFDRNIDIENMYRIFNLKKK